MTSLAFGLVMGTARSDAVPTSACAAGSPQCDQIASDVPTTAQGPLSSLLDGTYENTHIHDAMRMALELDQWVWLPLIIRD